MFLLYSHFLLAYEIISNPKKRRGYDSVDPTFINTIPKQSAANCGEQFYEVFGAAFETNARYIYYYTLLNIVNSIVTCILLSLAHA